MKNIRNIIRRPAIAAAAAALALYCAIPAAARASGDIDADAPPSRTVASLDQLADGYDADASGMTVEIEIPLP